RFATAASAPRLRRGSAPSSSMSSMRRCHVSAAISRRIRLRPSSRVRFCRALATSCVRFVSSSASHRRGSSEVSLVVQEIPKIGLVMEAVRVTRWLKNVGDTVRLGEPLVEVETEKSVVEIEATVSGRLVEILVQVGEEASVGTQIARLESDFETHAADRIRSSPVARKLAGEHGVDLG